MSKYSDNREPKQFENSLEKYKLKRNNNIVNTATTNNVTKEGCCCCCCDETIIGNRYLIPNCDANEIIMMTGKVFEGGIIQIQNTASALSKQSYQVVYKSFATPLAIPVNDILRDMQEGYRWVNSMVREQVFELTKIPVTKVLLEEYIVEAGDVINKDSEYIKPIKAQYKGIVTKTLINNKTIVYSYIADSDLVNYTCETVTSSSTLHPGGLSLYPQSSPILGSNCNGCESCGACGACGACAFCEEINFGVGLTATIAVHAVVSAASVSNTFIK